MIKQSLKLSFLTITVLLLSFHFSYSQYSSIKVREVHEAYTDSLKNIDYKYTFPIWGKKAYKKGFDIPYPAGVMSNYFWMKQGMVIENLQLGFMDSDTDIPLTDVDFIQFGDNTNVSQTVNVRPDLWVLPFLNVYGIMGYGSSHTEVVITAPVTLTSVVDQNIKTAGFGVMGAGGIGPVWFSVDATWTWNKPDLLEEAVKVQVVGARIGHTFNFNSRPDRNIAVWGGAMSMKMAAQTVGAITLKDALPDDFWQNKDQKVEDYWDWYNSLDPSNPRDQIKIKVADETLTPIVNAIDEKNGEGTVSYAMDKSAKEKWNGVFGAQFQLNKHWMFRTEAGLIGDRKSVLGSVNYRFCL